MQTITAAQAAAAARVKLDQVAATAENLVKDLPVRTLTVAGAAIIGLGILVSLLPRFYGPGLLWTLLTLVAGAVAVQQELRLPAVKLPAQVDHPLVGPLFALIAVVLTWSMLSLKIVPLIWLLGSLCVAYDQYKKAVAGPQGLLATQFDMRRSWQGYRRLFLIGLAVLVVSLLFKFDVGSSGRFSGGFSTRYSSYYEGTVSEWDATKYYYPGIPASTGRAMPLATLMQFAMVALVLWTGYRGGSTRPAWFRLVPLVGAGVLALWWLVSPKGGSGSYLFLLGLIPVGAAAYFLYRGQETGPWDGTQWLAQLRAKVARSSGGAK